MQQDPGRTIERVLNPAAAPGLRRVGGRRSSDISQKCCEKEHKSSGGALMSSIAAGK